jgi:membrane associated rhomboid family serine protease
MALLPFSDDPGPRRRFPFVNYALILINVGIFALELVKGQAFTDCFTEAFSLVPAKLVHHAVNAIPRTCVTQQHLHILAPFFLTLVTMMFLHAGFLHIFGNMLYLWVFGDNVEDRLGHIWYLIFYLFCGLVANAAQIYATYATHQDPTVLNLGASGAIAGVLGAYLIFYPAARVRTVVFLGIFFIFTRLSAYVVIGFFIVLQFAEAYILVEQSAHGQVQSGGVAFFAHIGGFIAGLILGLAVRLVGPAPKSTAISYPNWPQHPDLRGTV